MSDDPLESILQNAISTRRQSLLARSRVPLDRRSVTNVVINGSDGQTLLNFCSNDYLGLSRHAKIIAAVQQGARDHGAGSGASALITGHSAIHASAERAIARWKGTAGALLLPSGYQANHAAVQTICGAADAAGRRVRFCLDKLVHASLVDAVRGSGQPFRIVPHNDLTKLARLLDEADADELQVVVTESIFSMDGDAAPLREIAALKRERPFALLLDEAHASGVYGENGAGLADELSVGDAADITIVTLSKSLGLSGGAICASETFCEAVLNFGRAYIYSTSIAPALAAGAEAAIGILHEEPQRQHRVRELARRVREQLSAAGIAIAPGDSPIIPVMLGEERLASEAAKQLRAKGIMVLPVRPPTVPKGTSRLRVTLSSAHTDEEVELLIRSLMELRREQPLP